MDIAGHTILTITQVASQVKYSLERNFSNLWIQGEIASCKPYPSGHIYLTLKDGQSELSAVIFSQYARQLTHNPEPGLKVTVNGDLSLYSPRGQFQLQIKNLYPSGQGELWLEYEALRRRLESEGLFDPGKKKGIPRYPNQIGIITSSEGAALRDIIHVLKRRAPHVSCLIYPVRVQGTNAAREISTAIENMNHYGHIDTLIVGRGGGSLEDLWCFNDELVVRAIAKSIIPVISAVGHETDTTLADYAADCRAPTPSAAAEIAAEDRSESNQLLDNLEERMQISIENTLHNNREKLDALKNRHGFFKPNLILQQWQDKLNESDRRMKQTVLNYIKAITFKAEAMDNKLQILNPDAHLKRGFAIATDINNQIVYSPDQVDVNDLIQLKVARGEIATKVVHEKGSDV